MFALGLLMAMPLIASAASISARGECVRHYTVQQGDICDSISAANNVSTYQLKTINAGYIDAGCGNLIPGDDICIGYAAEDCSTTYVVVPDDTCEAITAAHGIADEILRTNNPQINAECDNIYIGEVLCVSSLVQVPHSGALTGGFVAATTASEPAPTASQEAEGEDEDDDDLPYCDEL
ncbi:hypothetical protein B0H17DRAFT_1163488 [Mycena rosella]|uniref:LysM domain-containing protein n=1 Tax=Mycena rosella TaxID=1033263 RepID=A0AAD7CND0_MYCRO|nr:hypothetical protein B0H17DRAFT_1163488 [Mycena rosella]